MNTVLILGNHPIKGDIIRQFRKQSREILDNPTPQIENIDLNLNDVEEIVILSQFVNDDSLALDNKALAVLKALEKDEKRRRIVHLMLQSQTSLWMMRNNNLVKDLSQYFDIYPFTLQDEWTKQEVRKMALPAVQIDIKSERRQHLVVFGIGEAAEALVINAALTFHYPNYTRNHRLRSRITMVSSDMERQMPKLLQRYEHLFKHSYYRLINTQKKDMVVSQHKPENLLEQEDYVDIEWEFVIADHNDTVLRNKLALWATSRLTQNLNIACATEDDERNLSIALHLPDEIYNSNIPVYLEQTDDSLINSVDFSCNRYKNLHPFGMDASGYDVTLPLVQMGQIVNDVYCQCYNDNYSGNYKQRESLYNAITIDDKDMHNGWSKLNMVKRYSNIFNAMTVRVKLHSVGIKEEEWDKCYDLPETIINVLAEVEHNRWNVEELILGFRPCTKAEQEAVEQDISLKEEYKKQRVHYDIRAYKDLRNDDTGRKVNIYDIVLTRSLPLIAAQYKEGGSR